MDYPFPLIRIDDNGDLDLADAYDDKIGEWDKRLVPSIQEPPPLPLTIFNLSVSTKLEVTEPTTDQSLM